MATYKRAQAKTGLGPDEMPKEPTPLQYRIAALIGRTATEGVRGAECCDTSLQPTPSNAVALIVPAGTSNLIERAAEESGSQG